MKAICFYFNIHQPYRLKKYRFFEIGNDHYYYDDFANDDIITRVAHNSYIPATEMLIDLIKENGKKFKVAFSISGTAIEQLQQYVPEFIDKLKELVATGCVEFLSETFSHSLASLYDIEEFRRQVELTTLSSTNFSVKNLRYSATQNCSTTTKSLLGWLALA